MTIFLLIFLIHLCFCPLVIWYITALCIYQPMISQHFLILCFFLSLIFFSQVDLCVCIYMCVFICISVPVCGCLWRQDDYHQCHFFSIAFWFLCDYSSSCPGPHCRLGSLAASPETHLSLFSSTGSTVLWVCTPQPSCITCFTNWNIFLALS